MEACYTYITTFGELMSWLEESIKRSKKLKDHYMLKGIDIFVKDQLPQGIDIDFVIRYVAKKLPDHVLRNIDIIYRFF